MAKLLPLSLICTLLIGSSAGNDVGLTPEQLADALAKLPGMANGPKVNLTNPEGSDNNVTPDGLSRSSFAGTKWPSNRIPYAIDDSTIPSDFMEPIAMAIAHIEQNTCIDFQLRNPATDSNYIHIERTDPNRCFARLGFNPNTGAHPHNLGTNCASLSVIVHEFYHNLGVVHEQSRPDRSDFVDVLWGNIAGTSGNQFYRTRFEDDPVTSFCPTFPEPNVAYDDCHNSQTVIRDGYPYDYSSVMHYQTTLFSAAGLNTVVSTNPDVPNSALGNNRLSFLDVAKIENAYGCRPELSTNPVDGFRNTATGTIDGTTLLDGKFEIVAPIGMGVQLNFHLFEFEDCSGFVGTRSSTLETPTQYCSTNQPDRLLQFSSHEVEVTFDRTNSNNQFFISWSFYPLLNNGEASCCTNINLMFVPGSPADMSFLGTLSFDGPYSISPGETTTFRGTTFPVYRGDNNAAHFISRSEINTFSSYQMGRDPESQLGSGSGFINIGPSIMCPHDMTTASFSGVADASDQISISCTTTCAVADAPATPADTTPVSPAVAPATSAAVGAVFRFTCNADTRFALFSACQRDGTWSAVSGACSDFDTSGPTTTSTTTTSTTTTSTTTTSTTTTSTTTTSTTTTSTTTTITTTTSTTTTTTMAPDGELPRIEENGAALVLTPEAPCAVAETADFGNGMGTELDGTFEYTFMGTDACPTISVTYTPLSPADPQITTECKKRAARLELFQGRPPNKRGKPKKPKRQGRFVCPDGTLDSEVTFANLGQPNFFRNAVRANTRVAFRAEVCLVCPN